LPASRIFSRPSLCPGRSAARRTALRARSNLFRIHFSRLAPELPVTQMKELRMKPSTTHRIKGSIHKVKGALKEKAGQVTNNANLKVEGQDETLTGRIQEKLGQIEKVFEK
jgi:uncharacterized protein YjbJ (UPF0337 family)